MAREEPLLQTSQANHRKLQPLAAVQRHQGDTVHGGVLAVGITGQCGTGQESLQISSSFSSWY